MTYTAPYLPEPDRKLLRRCRILNEDLDALRNFLPDQKIIDTLSRLNLDELPRNTRRQVEIILRSADKLRSKQAELDGICVRAEKAAHRIAHDTLRRIAKLYDLDCRSDQEIAKELGCSKATAQKYIRILNTPPETV